MRQINNPRQDKKIDVHDVDDNYWTVWSPDRYNFGQTNRGLRVGLNAMCYRGLFKNDETTGVSH